MAELDLGNYIILEPGRTVSVKISSWNVVPKTIKDPLTGQIKTVNSLVLTVTELDGTPVNKQLSLLSQKAASTLRPYLESGTYQNRLIRITRTGSGFASDYSFVFEAG